MKVAVLPFDLTLCQSYAERRFDRIILHMHETKTDAQDTQEGEDSAVRNRIMPNTLA